MADSVEEHRNQHKLSNQDDNEEGEVEAPHRLDDPTHGAQDGLSRLVEEVLDPAQRRSGLDPEPAQDRVGEHDQPDVGLDQPREKTKNTHQPARIMVLVAAEAALNQSLA